MPFACSSNLFTSWAVQISAGELYTEWRNVGASARLISMRATSSTCARDNSASGAKGMEMHRSGDADWNICARQGDEVFLIPGPTTLAIRKATNSIAPDWLR